VKSPTKIQNHKPVRRITRSREARGGSKACPNWPEALAIIQVRTGGSGLEVSFQDGAGIGLHPPTRGGKRLTRGLLTLTSLNKKYLTMNPEVVLVVFSEIQR
jgi:hypothetical protein